MKRSLRSEIIDDPALSDEVMDLVYADLARTHTALGNTRTLVSALRKDSPVFEIAELEEWKSYGRQILFDIALYTVLQQKLLAQGFLVPEECHRLSEANELRFDDTTAGLRFVWDDAGRAIHV